MNETPSTEIRPGQFVEYRGTTAPNGAYVVEAVVEIDGEARFNIRSIPCFVRRGVTVHGPRYRHNGVGEAMPIRLGMVGRSSMMVVRGMTIDDITEVTV